MDATNSDLWLELDDALPRRERDRRRRIRDFLAAAQRLVLSEGFGAFSMQRLAEATGFSPGGVYAYFESKEDVLTALAVESNQRRVTLYRRVLEFDARPRERMVAMGEVGIILYPEFFNTELLHYTECFRDRVSESRRDRLRGLDRTGHGCAVQIIEDAIRCGDLVLPTAMTTAELAYTLSMHSVGVLGAIGIANAFEDRGVTDTVRLMRRSGSVLMDGWGWRPLSTEWDYRQTMRRIYDEVFPAVLIHQARSF